MIGSQTFNEEMILRKISEKIDMMPIECNAVRLRLLALATATVPPAWGYAGLLLQFVDDGDVVDVFDVYATINEWRKNPKEAEMIFRAWNAERLKEGKRL